MRLSKCMEENRKWLDSRLTYFDKSGYEQECVLVELPFFDKEKLLPRGLENSDV